MSSLSIPAEKSTSHPPSPPTNYINVPDLLPRPIACPIALPRRANKFFSSLLPFMAFCVLVYLTFTVLQLQIVPSSNSLALVNETLFVPPLPEAYATFLASTTETEPWYFNEVRRLVFQLKYDPLTADDRGRDVVVIATPGVPEEQITQLEQEGAIVHRRPLLEELPLPEGLIDRWKEVYTKLFVFNMTEYERVLFLDADQLLVKPMSEVWQDPNSWPDSGLAACGESPGAWDHPTPILDLPYLNSGLFLARPNTTLFENIIAERDFDPGFPEQNLLNKYFSRDGSHPWQPLDHKFVTTFPTHIDLEYGIHSLHDKMWYGHIDRELKEVWRQSLGRMEGYWLAKGFGEESWNSTIPVSS